MAKPQPKRVVACKDGYDEKALSLALGYTKLLIDDAGVAAPDLVLLTHTKRQLQSTSLAGMLGPEASRALSAGKQLHTPVGPLRHATLRTLGNSGNNTIVIAFYADEKMLDELDSMPGLIGIVVVPDREGDIANWVKRWTVQVHGEKPGTPTSLISDPLIETAMRALTTITNTSYGCLNSRDTEHADEIFRILRNKGHILDPLEIKNWAVREGWHTGAANDAAKIAAKIAKLKQKPSLAKFHDPTARYLRWKAESKEPKDFE